VRTSKPKEKELKFVNLPREDTMPLTSYNDRYFREDSAPRIWIEFSSREQPFRYNFFKELKFCNSV